MTAKGDDQPDREAAAARERLAAALRANLQRRKAQARARASRERGSSHDSAGIVEDKTK